MEIRLKLGNRNGKKLELITWKWEDGNEKSIPGHIKRINRMGEAALMYCYV